MTAYQGTRALMRDEMCFVRNALPAAKILFIDILLEIFVKINAFSVVKRKLCCTFLKKITLVTIVLQSGKHALKEINN